MITLFSVVIDTTRVLSFNIHTTARPGAAPIKINFLVIPVWVITGFRKGVRYPRMGNIGFSHLLMPILIREL